MESTNAEISLQQRADKLDSSSESPPSPWETSSSIADSSFVTLECDNCTSTCSYCDFGTFADIRGAFYFEDNCQARKNPYYIPRKKRNQPISLTSLILHEDAKSPKTNEVSKKTAAKSKNKLFKNYCPYSSDNCGCSSGCTDCDYGLYSYTVKNKSKLKNNVKKLYVRASSGFRPLKTSDRCQLTTKSFDTTNILEKEKAKSPKKKTSDSCYPESSSNCDYKPDYVKRDFELCATEGRIMKPKKKTSVKISRKQNSTRTLRTPKLLRNKRVSKKKATKVSEINLKQNWFPDSPNSGDYNSTCTDGGKDRVVTKRKKLKNKYERARASTNSRMPELSSVIDGAVTNGKDSKQTAETFSKRRSPRYPSDYSENDPHFSGED
ncbi:PREDICTED: uncharacterized protein LOC105567485 isoform X2 [Vollenhovia emeryi]|uniref:uncharacterized protein LOC105567485 isoform X2 n=1 Tax=Vollenhovia emeryi TaxID=411798 RepID=UPI0005F4B567|nr:PREDICTED: uncharacterized protein LOC105567485 isoform X2 [Vollenhovia emeryi]